jgi:hypothetical protein
LQRHITEGDRRIDHTRKKGIATYFPVPEGEFSSSIMSRILNLPAKIGMPIKELTPSSIQILLLFEPRKVKQVGSGFVEGASRQPVLEPDFGLHHSFHGRFTPFWIGNSFRHSSLDRQFACFPLILSFRRKDRGESLFDLPGDIRMRQSGGSGRGCRRTGRRRGRRRSRRRFSV